MQGEYDVIVVGAGFAGAVTARELADNQKKVLIIEKRNHIAGNMYDGINDFGIMVQHYGPHIFHTNEASVFAYLKKFSDWFKYEHKVLSRINDKFVPMPFNLKTVEMLFDQSDAEDIKNSLTNTFPGIKKVSVVELLESKDEKVRDIGNFIFEKAFKNYTAKQWGVSADKVDKNVIGRVPVVLDYDDRYFHDEFQFMPKKGFTELFKNILSHPNIEIKLNTDAKDVLKLDLEKKEISFMGKIWYRPIIYTGPIDELMENKFGMLPYRSLDLVFENLNVTYSQKVAVVNYPNEEKFTRITEFKYLTQQKLKDKTTILKEYPLPYNPNFNIPYYPIINKENTELYEKYFEMTKLFKKLYLCGRLADYTYYNMDSVIIKALHVAKEVLDEN